MTKMEEIENAITECLNNGIDIPKMETDDEKEAWYDKMVAGAKEFKDEWGDIL